MDFNNMNLENLATMIGFGNSTDPKKNKAQKDMLKSAVGLAIGGVLTFITGEALARSMKDYLKKEEPEVINKTEPIGTNEVQQQMQPSIQPKPDTKK